MCGLAGLIRAFRRPALSAERLRWEAQPESGYAFTRKYRADAQVILLSVPLLRRRGVGAGRVTWSENTRFRLLDFTGYSIPDRAGGLNRLGFVRELTRREPDSAESIYFGLMTASPEESAAEARKALHQETREQMYTAIEGRIAPGDVETVTSHFMAPARLSVAQNDDLLAMARHALSDAPPKTAEFDPHGAPRPTFLQALAALLQDPSSTATRYVYNARLYSLTLRRSPDPKATAYFREARLVPPGSTVIRAEGRLCREVGGKEIDFQVWVEEGARPLPLRIEYQPKSYLRLTFEADAAVRASGGDIA
jgi:hypothetical protein